MKRYIKNIQNIENLKPVESMACIGFVTIGTTNTIEVYVWTNDPGKVPHFYVRKYGKNGKYDWKLVYGTTLQIIFFMVVTKINFLIERLRNNLMKCFVILQITSKIELTGIWLFTHGILITPL